MPELDLSLVNKTEACTPRHSKTYTVNTNKCCKSIILLSTEQTAY
jgi:hypothetical protein